VLSEAAWKTIQRGIAFGSVGRIDGPSSADEPMWSVDVPPGPTAAGGGAPKVYFHLDAARLDDVLAATPPAGRHVYEVLDARLPCYAFFDLDGVGQNATQFRATVAAVATAARRELMRAPVDGLRVDTISLECDRAGKASRHLVFKTHAASRPMPLPSLSHARALAIRVGCALVRARRRYVYDITNVTKTNDFAQKRPPKKMSRLLGPSVVSRVCALSVEAPYSGLFYLPLRSAPLRLMGHYRLVTQYLTQPSHIRSRHYPTPPPPPGRLPPTRLWAATAQHASAARMWLPRTGQRPPAGNRTDPHSAPLRQSVSVPPARTKPPPTPVIR